MVLHQTEAANVNGSAVSGWCRPPSALLFLQSQLLAETSFCLCRGGLVCLRGPESHRAGRRSLSSATLRSFRRRRRGLAAGGQIIDKRRSAVAAHIDFVLLEDSIKSQRGDSAIGCSVPKAFKKNQNKADKESYLGCCLDWQDTRRERAETRLKLRLRVMRNTNSPPVLETPVGM